MLPSSNSPHPMKGNRVLIIGASGMVGAHLFEKFQSLGADVTGTYASHPISGLHPASLEKPTDIAEIFAISKPHLVICSGAWVWVDGCQADPERAFRINRDGAKVVAQNAARHKTRMVYISSNYIFDGKSGPYSETDSPNPINVYGETKLAAEQSVKAEFGDEVLIIRTVGVYGIELKGKNFVYQVIRNLRAGRRMRVPSDQLGNATHAGELTEGVANLVAGNKTGVWNLAGPDPFLSRKDFALRIANEYGLDTGLFDFIPTAELKQQGPRPLNAGLLIEKARREIGFAPSQWIPFEDPKDS